MNSSPLIPADINRRTFLRTTSTGIGSVVMASLLKQANGLSAAEIQTKVDRWKGVVTQPHFPAKAKRIIYLCMAGGPSHLETLDYKPKLA